MVSLELSKVVSSFLNRCFSRKLYSGPIGNLPSEESDEFSLVCSSIHLYSSNIQKNDFMSISLQ